MQSSLQFIRLEEVLRSTGVGRSTFYAAMTKGLMPKAVKISSHAVAWPAHEISAVNAARIAGYPDCKVREVVTQLHELRSRDLSPRLAGMA